MSGEDVNYLARLAADKSQQELSDQFFQMNVDLQWLQRKLATKTRDAQEIRLAVSELRSTMECIFKLLS